MALKDYNSVTICARDIIQWFIEEENAFMGIFGVS